MNKNINLDSDTLLKSILSSTDELIVFVDRDGIIEQISDSYAKFLGVKVKDAIGKHVKTVIENTRLPEIMESRTEESGQIHNINGKSMISSRAPIFRDGEVVGAFGRVLFKNLDDFNKLHSKVNAIEKELVFYKQKLSQFNSAKYTLESIIGSDNHMVDLKNNVRRISKSSSNVLISGESGTGKELFAHAIHNLSSRAEQSFVCINCATIPKELIESEFFGYEEGSFTGAKKGGKMGFFQAANGGSIFLDEIGELPLDMQAKLLRVIQEKEIQKIGSTTRIPIDVRIIVATNRSLFNMVGENLFREDLYYRLNVVSLSIPPLRERKSDIIELAEHFLEKYAIKERSKKKELLSSTKEYLRQYAWPGNVRELENALERAINLMDEETYIKPDHLPVKITGMEKMKRTDSLKNLIEETEKKAIIQALANNKGRKTLTAKELGISRTALYERLEKYNLGG